MTGGSRTGQSLTSHRSLAPGPPLTGMGHGHRAQGVDQRSIAGRPSNRACCGRAAGAGLRGIGRLPIASCGGGTTGFSVLPLPRGAGARRRARRLARRFSHRRHVSRRRLDAIAVRSASSRRGRGGPIPCEVAHAHVPAHFPAAPARPAEPAAGARAHCAALDPADMGTEFGLEATLVGTAAPVAPAPDAWRRAADGVARPHGGAPSRLNATRPPDRGRGRVPVPPRLQTSITRSGSWPAGSSLADRPLALQTTRDAPPRARGTA